MAVQPVTTSRLVIRDVRADDVDAFCAFLHQEPFWRDLPIDPADRFINPLPGECLFAGSGR